MRLVWLSAVCVGALASTIPRTNSLQLCLPSLPSPNTLENSVQPTLLLNWSIQNGSLYANDDQAYPSSVTMQIRAPFRGGSDKTTFSRTAVELSCTIDSRPLSTGQVGAVADILRVRVELLDLHGNVVSLDAVAADLIYRYGSSHGGHHEDYFSQNSRPWLIKYWKTQLVSLFKKAKKPSIVDEDSTPSVELLAQEAATNSPDGDGAAESEAEPHFSIPSSWNASSYPDYRSTHCRPHRRCPKPNNAFMHLVRGIIFPTVLGAVASLVACLFGFLFGQLLRSFSPCLGWCRTPRGRGHLF